jgi:hypothetical protein
MWRQNALYPLTGNRRDDSRRELLCAGQGVVLESVQVDFIITR